MEATLFGSIHVSTSADLILLNLPGLSLRPAELVRYLGIEGSFRSPKMPVYPNDVMHLVNHLSQEEKIQVAVKCSAKAAVLACITVFAGGLVGGPPGIAVGGAVGGLLGAWMTSGQFKPLPQILMELPPNQRQMFLTDVHNVIRHLDWTDAAQLIALVMGNPTLKIQVLHAIKLFFLNQLNAEVRYPE